MKNARRTLVLLAIFAMAMMLLIPSVALASIIPDYMEDGYVKTVSGTPIQGATVLDIAEHVSATTNAQGYWRIFTTYGGQHSVKASKLGYEDRTKTLLISAPSYHGVANFNLPLVVSLTPPYSGTVISSVVDTRGGSSILLPLEECNGPTVTLSTGEAKIYPQSASACYPDFPWGGNQQYDCLIGFEITYTAGFTQAMVFHFNWYMDYTIYINSICGSCSAIMQIFGNVYDNANYRFMLADTSTTLVNKLSVGEVYNPILIPGLTPLTLPAVNVVAGHTYTLWAWVKISVSTSDYALDSWGLGTMTTSEICLWDTHVARLTSVNW